MFQTTAVAKSEGLDPLFTLLIQKYFDGSNPDGSFNLSN